MEYPSKVYFGEEFEVKIILKEYPQDTYSVKFDILTNDGRIAMIYNPNSGRYQSTYYYVPNIFEERQDGALIKLKLIKNYEGEANISVRIRNSKGKVDELDGYRLNVLKILNRTPNESNLQNIKINEKVREEKNETEQKIENKSLTYNDGTNKSNDETNELIERVINNIDTEIIQLNKPIDNIKKEEYDKILFKSSNQIVKEYAIIAFLFFAITLIILILIDRKNEPNN
ncbi:MAG: hypothetical protein QXI33_03670 [Candidatus Pacearchaeota archaeon]